MRRARAVLGKADGCAANNKEHRLKPMPLKAKTPRGIATRSLA